MGNIGARQEEWWNRFYGLSQMNAEEAFSRQDESEDAQFYRIDRFVDHLDQTALETAESMIGQLIVRENPVILDLMSSWDSHIPERVKAARVVGLGLNRNELAANRRLTDAVIHDLNLNPRLPFQDNTFDVVLNTVSVDYMTRPLDVFHEVGRILKPGGLFLVIFSNRMFPGKAVRFWRETSEAEHRLIVEDFFRETGLFEKPESVTVKGRPRPEGDKYAGTGLPSDPVYAVYAEKSGAPPDRLRRPEVHIDYGESLPPEELQARMKDIGRTMKCPYCGRRLSKWRVPDNPFAQTWDNEFMRICFNDRCPYFVRGWDVMGREGNGSSYRLMYNPEKDVCLPVPVPTPFALREGIVDDE